MEYIDSLAWAVSETVTVILLLSLDPTSQPFRHKKLAVVLWYTYCPGLPELEGVCGPEPCWYALEEYTVDVDSSSTASVFASAFSLNVQLIDEQSYQLLVLGPLP